MDMVEKIIAGGKVLAYIIRGSDIPPETTFVTPPEANFQAGFVVYPAGGEIARHIHRPSERHIVGTSEVLLVRKGRCEVDIYDEKRRLTATRELKAGDVLVLLSGGHSFRMFEDTAFLEIKQGPYLGLDDKERF
jgi:mannose-6-phosphate isomerase-like protein (cupin superfamily)